MTEHILLAGQIGAILAFMGTTFLLYRLLVAQQKSIIELLQEKISFLQEQLVEARAKGPDVLARVLSDRVDQLERELVRLKGDQNQNKELIDAKELELSRVRDEIGTFQQKLTKAEKLLHEFLCPYCGAPLSEREIGPDQTHHGFNLYEQYDHTITIFTCGLVMHDGAEHMPCKNRRLVPPAS